MRLPDNINDIPFEIIGGDFYHLDIKEAWNYNQDAAKNKESSKFHFSYKDFEENLIETLQKQIDENKYEVLAYFPEVRDTLEKLANAKQGEDHNNVVEEINRFLVEKGIKPIEEFEKLPVWITCQEYEDIVKQSRKIKDNEENIPWDSLHIYLQNLCGRIFHFKDIPELKDIVFIDPNWLHTSIYRVLNMEVLNKGGEFTIKEADKVIDGGILDASTFLEAMKAFELIFEIPNQQPRSFIAPQYLPKESNLNEAQLKKYKEYFHRLELTLKFPKYLPPSLISRIISLKGHLIKNLDEPLWKYGACYTESEISTLLICQPEEKTIKIYLQKGIDETQRKIALRQFMIFLEEYFTNDLNEMLLSLPVIAATIKWNQLYTTKKGGRNGVDNVDADDEHNKAIPSEPFEFLVPDFEKPPIEIFICYSHKNQDNMKIFTKELKNKLESFQSQHDIRFRPFTDLELASGDIWHQKIQDRIRECDILICLLSDSFFTSEYIQKEEYGKIMADIALSNKKTHIVPVYFESCYISPTNNIQNIQFFKPEATDFELGNTDDFSFSNLAQNRSDLIPNYMGKLLKEIEPKIKDIWRTKESRID